MEEGFGHRRDSPRRYDGQGRDRDHDYHRSRYDRSSPPRGLNYDDDGMDESAHAGRYRDDPRHSGVYDRNHSRGRSRSPDRVPGDRGRSSRAQNGPRTIVLTDVPEDATELDIEYGLEYVTEDRHMAEQLDRVRFNYDHNGHRIAFVEFWRAHDAEYFMSKYQPTVTFPLEHSRGIQSEPLTFEMSFRRNDAERSRDRRRRSREQRTEQRWNCQCGMDNFRHRTACFKCHAERPADNGHGYTLNPAPSRVLTGESDEGKHGEVHYYLVVRNLGATVNEQTLADGVMKLFIDITAETNKPAPKNKLKSTAPITRIGDLGAKPGSLRRVFLMRDCQSQQSRKYGFAEFATVEDAQGAVAKFHALGDKLTIGTSADVKVNFIHAGVFVEAPPNANPMYTFTPIHNPSVRLKYWDPEDRSYPSIHNVSIGVASDHPSPEKQDLKEAAQPTNRGSKVKKPKRDQESASAAIPIAMNPEIQRWQMKSFELHGQAQKAGADYRVFGNNEPKPVLETYAQNVKNEQPEPDGPAHPHWTDQYISYGDWDRFSCLICDWVAPPQETLDKAGYPEITREVALIDHEVRIHDHYKAVGVKEKAAANLAALGREPRTIVRRQPRLKSEPLKSYLSYADLEALRCALCRRKFPVIEALWRHEQESELHKKMLAVPGNKERAEKELNAIGKTLHRMCPDKKSREQEQQRPQYRDRAKERREVFGQPKKPAPVAGERKKERAEAVAAEVPLEKKSKGADILAKMGWTAGVGLGAEGTGRTEAIATEAYAPGVGLGAEGSKLGDAAEEAARKTRGNPSDFVEKTRDKARERFEKL
ncbi:hypothetical protein B0H66DRAFT_544165 [Apodospora peruviana]|uniref:RNA-binding protein n=1 Tax=Apodospora peruviana TaxID=516989 RepID=A0AAE0ITY7_9PEZI|nr:hypothetical protein B0H66DRAFT_544165 [Apodospora peruviana]